jgi:antitoxin (DNA-binding transcriptional repressor) of toxin-antitoxin stability system
MAKSAERKRSQRTKSRHPSGASWQLKDAKARFSEVVRRARTIGPQRVTVRGEEVAVSHATSATSKRAASGS